MLEDLAQLLLVCLHSSWTGRATSEPSWMSPASNASFTSGSASQGSKIHMTSNRSFGLRTTELPPSDARPRCAGPHRSPTPHPAPPSPPCSAAPPDPTPRARRPPSCPRARNNPQRRRRQRPAAGPHRTPVRQAGTGVSVAQVPESGTGTVRQVPESRCQP